MKRNVIAIIGRPNVGKSTLFNRIIGKPHSIVSEVEGVTRDRVRDSFVWGGSEYDIIDTGGFINNSKDLIIIREDKDYDKRIILKKNTIWNQYIFRLDNEINLLNSKVLNRDIAYIPKDIVEQGLYIRNWHTGDYYLNNNQQKKKVSKLFIKNKFNNYNKMYYPLIVNSDDEIIWIPGLINIQKTSQNSSNNNYIKISKEILN